MGVYCTQMRRRRLARLVGGSTRDGAESASCSAECRPLEGPGQLDGPVEPLSSNGSCDADRSSETGETEG